MSNINYTVLINSCDKYEDAWYYFFELLKKYWPTRKGMLILNTETKQYQHKDLDIQCVNLKNGSNEDVKWGKRLYDCLLTIHTEYVILLLEDFFLQNNVDCDELNSCLSMMNNDSNIAAIYFKRITGFTDTYELNQKYYHMKQNKSCKLNLQAGLWRKDVLQSLVDPQDTPWSFEECGYKRINNQELVFLCSKDGTHTNYRGCVFPYLTDRRLGYGIWLGKWLWNNNKLFRKNGIKIKPITMEKFHRIDLLKYYLRRIKEKLSAKFGGKNEDTMDN